MITLRFRSNTAFFTANVNEPQILADEHCQWERIEQLAPITVKSVSAAWNLIRRYRDEVGSVVENEILEVTADEGTDLSQIPAAIIFKRNTKGKLEFKDYNKLLEREERKAAVAAAKKAIEKAAIQTVNDVLTEETEDYPDQGEEYVNKDLALSLL